MTWKEHNYEIVITEDHSPSLHWRPHTEARGELMHHRGGALSETLEIYGSVIDQALGAGAGRFLSVGLGLGYNEFLITHRAHAPTTQIWTYESDPFLVSHLLDFINQPNSHIETHQVYRDILSQMGASVDLVCGRLRELYQSQHWKILGALAAGSLPTEFVEVILYDAFSSKSTPELWQEDFLNQFLSAAANPRGCWFSTYACTGPLKRALKAQGFEVILRPGFHGKRNSTLGVLKPSLVESLEIS